MKMSKGQIGRRLLGLAVAGMALVAGGTAFAEWRSRAVGSHAAASRLPGDGKHRLVP